MTVLYPKAVPMLVPDANTFNGVNQLVIVNHCTGGDQTVQAIYNTFIATRKSSHFGIGYGGEVAQFVSLDRGAGANCCADGTHDPFWNPYIAQYGNLNLCTVSIEHCNDGAQSRTLTDAQLFATQQLQLWLCQKYNIDTAHIWYHSSIDATNCPGNAFMTADLPAIKSFVQQGGDPHKMFSDGLCIQVWNSFFLSQGMAVPPRDTGIMNSWRDQWRNHGNFLGCPITPEYGIDAGVAQNYAGGTCVWINNTPTWL